ncbi:M23 family metallopeptidase [Thermasporomyces composti]|uniref:M23 family metallopeptidase n=1 Tax=Thermasporomyces composti TaxID=696763 RepID=UPI0011C061C2|nr:M23 family metallopeptidase [Thermasporomyces composti]
MSPALGSLQANRTTQPSPQPSPQEYRRATGTSRGGRRRASRSTISATRLGRAARPAGGKRKKAAGNRTPASTFPTVPAVAGVATLVAAATGAMTVHAAAPSSAPTTEVRQSAPAGIALTVNQLHEARSAAASRADRSRGDDARAKAEAAAREAERQRRLAAAERAVWEAERTKELQLIEKSARAATQEQTFERVIQWYLPLRSFRLSAYFGDAGSMWSHNHTGLDFAAPLGSPVRAIGDGEIIEAGYDGPYGNKIAIRHPDGTVTWYCHLSGYERRSGYVAAGTTIGYVGSTGNSSGPHLHLEVRPGGGDPIDPLPWLRQLGLPI